MFLQKVMVILMNRFRSIVYKLNESNANNPANLLVGQEIKVNWYDDSGDVTDTLVGRLEAITNDTVVVRDIHTGKSHDYQFNGFNAHENGIEFNCIDEPHMRFYVY